MPDDVLDFLIRKGGFVILVDSLNEAPEAADSIRPFLNRDANNTVLMASQTDVLRRPDVAAFNVIDVSEEQAAAYLADAIGPDTWDALPPGLRAMTRNPQDLALVAEVAARLGPGNLPSRRAALYATKVDDDSALRAWVATADPRLGVIYTLAFRMLAERRILDEPTLAAWVREAVAVCELDPDEVGTVTDAVRRSRLFRETIAHDRLGRPQPVLVFDHELIGAFIAARHVASVLKGPEREAMLDLAEQERWQEVLFFVVDELATDDLAEALLDSLMTRGGDTPPRIVAYAIESKRDEVPPLPGRIEHAYASAKLRQDVQMTPAA